MLQWAAYRAQDNSDADGAGSAAVLVRRQDRFDKAVIECRRDVRRMYGVPVRLEYGGAGFTWAR